MNRREILQVLGTLSGSALLPGKDFFYETLEVAAKPFTYCLNMATIRGHKLGFVKELEVASKAGFRSVEIWVDSLQGYLDNGGTLKEAAKRLNDLGIRVESAIGFAEWIVDDDTKRAQGLERMKREMDMLAQFGCKRTAAPPAGATAVGGLDLRKAGERYRTVLEIGDKSGVVPHLELWGFSKNCSRLSEVLYVALESGHPSAKVLLDIFHMYKGGSAIESLQLVNTSAVDILHINDYPANLSPSAITDADRIYPGDGVAPIRETLKLLSNPRRPLILSFEVFNKNYYNQDALVVAKTALKKMMNYE